MLTDINPLWFGLAAGVVLYVAIAKALAWWTRPAADLTVHWVGTEDGWQLPLVEYPGAKDGPVIYLQHGLAANHRAFDLSPRGESPARRLAGQGFHVFAGNLRGRPLGTYKNATPPTWGFSHYLLHDLPPILAAITRQTGKPIHWVGHSMGGILGLSYAAHFQGAGLASVTSLGSALHYGVGSSVFHLLNKARPILKNLKSIPWATLQPLAAPLGACGIGQSALCNTKNMTSVTLAATLSHVFVDMTREELLELGTSFTNEGILCEELQCLLPELAKKLPVPWFSVIGTADRQCPPDCAEWTYARIEAPRKELFLAGKQTGCRHDYGHFDLISGRHAEEEIWPRVADFVRSTSELARLG